MIKACACSFLTYGSTFLIWAHPVVREDEAVEARAPVELEADIAAGRQLAGGVHLPREGRPRCGADQPAAPPVRARSSGGVASFRLCRIRADGWMGGWYTNEFAVCVRTKRWAPKPIG